MAVDFSAVPIIASQPVGSPIGGLPSSLPVVGALNAVVAGVLEPMNIVNVHFAPCTRPWKLILDLFFLRDIFLSGN